MDINTVVRTYSLMVERMAHDHFGGGSVPSKSRLYLIEMHVIKISKTDRINS